MNNGKAKLVATIAALLILLATAAFLGGPSEKKSSSLYTTQDLNQKKLAGITGMRISEENAGVFFETLLGISLSGYHAVDTMPELMYELKSGRADAIWCPDVTARYLLHTEEGKELVSLTAPKDTAQSAENGGRLEFALALRPEEETLCTELSAAIREMQADKTLEKLLVAYVEADTPMDFYADEKGSGRKLYVGVTGTLPPLDRFDKNGVPCGFSQAFLSELAGHTGYRFIPVKVTPQDAFTALCSGKVDLLFCFGTGKNTTPGKRDYITTCGYYTMQEYAYLSVK